MSLPEVLLWQRLRGSRAGAKFRRQHPIGPYIVDFFCAAARLIVEIDGQAHNLGERAQRDDTRIRFLEENGYRVLRVPAANVLRDVDAVADNIAHAASPLHHQPAAGGPPSHAGEDLR